MGGMAGLVLLVVSFSNCYITIKWWWQISWQVSSFIKGASHIRNLESPPLLFYIIDKFGHMWKEHRPFISLQNRSTRELDKNRVQFVVLSLKSSNNRQTKLRQRFESCGVVMVLCRKASFLSPLLLWLFEIISWLFTSTTPITDCACW